MLSQSRSVANNSQGLKQTAAIGDCYQSQKSGMQVLTPAESDSHYMMLANGVVNDDLSGKRTFDVNSPSNIIASDPNDR